MKERKMMKGGLGGKLPYEPPRTKKYDPLDIVRGSPSGTSLYSVSLYTECSLYYYY